MKTLNNVVVFDYDEFDKLLIDNLGFPKDFSIIASQEWGNYQDHLFEIDQEDLDDLCDFEREDCREILLATKKYRDAIKENSGVDPYIGYMSNRVENEKIKQARKDFFHATNFEVWKLLYILIAKGVLKTGNYLIRVFW